MIQSSKKCGRMGGSSLSGMANDLRGICEALRELETVSVRKVVDREPKRLERRAAS